MKKQDLTGDKYGKLTVLDRLENGKYRCRCECGNITEVFHGNLTKNHTTSCGCNKYKSVIEVGKKFKSALVLRRIDDNGITKYECKCECENIFVITSGYMLKAEKIMCRKCGNKKRVEARKESEVYKTDYINGTQLSQLGKMTSANKSGTVGVNFDKSRGKWMASIRFQGKKYNLGRFDSIQDAIDTRKKKEIEMFGHEL